MAPLAVLYWVWAVMAVVMVVVAVVVSRRIGRGALGVLVDSRGRYSLSQLQVVSWSVVLLSLLAGVFAGRVAAGAADPLTFRLPPELLGALGITIGSAFTALAVKASKDDTRPETIAANDAGLEPRLAQIFLVEQGEQADKAIDVTKYQNFWITLLVLVGYVSTVVSAVGRSDSLADFDPPGFSGTLLALLGISHAAYIAGKLPNHSGVPDGPTVLSVTDPQRVAGDPLLAAKEATPRYRVGRSSAARTRREAAARTRREAAAGSGRDD
jgi:hypothetical protein